MIGSVDSIETFGLVDGPGVRVVVFLRGCKCRCKYCHNPEMWKIGPKNMTAKALFEKIIRYKPYFKQNGGVTFSGGEPIIQSEFLIEVCKLLRQEQIHIAIDTAGVGNGNYENILTNIDLILFDVKHTDELIYKEITGQDMKESLKFIEIANKLNKTFWIRQVVVPEIMDNEDYIEKLAEYLKKIDNIDRIDFLPYHKLGSEKYEVLKLINPYKNIPEMDIIICDSYYKKFIEIYSLLR